MDKQHMKEFHSKGALFMNRMYTMFKGQHFKDDSNEIHSHGGALCQMEEAKANPEKRTGK